MPEQALPKPYRFGFVLTTAAGNNARYLNLRKYAERDPEVECVWAPISHYVESRFYRRLPLPIRMRLYVLHQAWPVLRQLGRFDAVMFHAFEPYALSALRSRFRRKPLLVWSQDNPPIGDPAKRLPYGEYGGGNHARSEWRRRQRFRFDTWCARQVALFLPWSRWAASILTEDCGVPREKVRVLNVGLDLEQWPYLPKTDVAPGARPQILFVGGSFERKGGDLLLEVYKQHFANTADLHLVTKEPPCNLPPNVHTYTDLEANDPRLRQLYADCDLFVLPTRADVSSLASMEAMATGRPVIVTPVGGIPDIVCDGKTGFLIPPNDAEALTDRMRRLLADPALRRRMGAEGRAVVEERFNAAITVPRILAEMKRIVKDYPPQRHKEQNKT